MTRVFWLLAALLTLAAAVSFALAAGPLRVQDIDGLVVGDLVIEPDPEGPNPVPIGQAGRDYLPPPYERRREPDRSSLGPPGRFTGFAFAPGRPELAYCAIEENGAERVSVLRVVQVPKLWPEPREEVRETIRDEYTGEEIPLRTDVVWVTAPFAERERTLISLPVPTGIASGSAAALEGPISWSPDGAWLAVCARRGPNAGSALAQRPPARDLWLVDYGTGRRRPLTEGVTVGPFAWSPDSTWLAYVVQSASAPSTPDAPGLWLRHMPSGKARRVADGGTDPGWSSDSGRLRFRAPGASGKWQEYDVTAGALQAAPAVSAAVSLWEVSPDGRYVARIVREAGKSRLEVRERATDTLQFAVADAAQVGCWSPDGRMLTYLTGEGSAHLWMTALEGPHRGRGVRVADKVIPYEVAQQPSVQWSGPLGLTPPEDPFWQGMSWVPSVWQGMSWVAFVAEGQLRVLRMAHRVPTTHEAAALGKLTPEEERAIVYVNAKQIALALLMYAEDYDEVTPPTYRTVDKLAMPYVKDSAVFDRPGYPDQPVFRYLLPNMPKNRIENPAETPFGVIDYWDEGGYVAWADGHVTWVSREEFDAILQRAEELEEQLR